MAKKEYVFKTEKERYEAELALANKINELDEKFNSDVRKIIIGLLSLAATSLFWIAMPMLIPSFVALVVGKILIATPFAICSIVDAVIITKALIRNRKFLKYCDEHTEVKYNAVVLEENNNEVEDKKSLDKNDSHYLNRKDKIEAIKKLYKQIKKDKTNNKADNKAKNKTNDEDNTLVM